MNESMHARTPALLAAIPNLLSLMRLALGIAFPWVPAEWRLGVVLVAAFSDLLDGVSSRTLHAVSATGRVLDPIADKVFVACVLLVLMASGDVEIWQAALVGSRDLSVSAAAALLVVIKGRAGLKHVPPTLLGKATTAAQFVFFVGLMIDPELAGLLLVPAAVLSVLAGADYLRRYALLAWRMPRDARPSGRS
jgi:CDP-diacylglycerol--glycerol-3-phosphate 3-phosphatidyltransferase